MDAGVNTGLQAGRSGPAVAALLSQLKDVWEPLRVQSVHQLWLSLYPKYPSIYPVLFSQYPSSRANYNRIIQLQRVFAIFAMPNPSPRAYRKQRYPHRSPGILACVGAIHNCFISFFPLLSSNRLSSQIELLSMVVSIRLLCVAYPAWLNPSSPHIHSSGLLTTSLE